MRASIATLLLALSTPAWADDIVTWVDAEGVTHFTNARLAPRDAAMVEVAPANGMAVPQPLPSRSSSAAGRGPVLVIIEKPDNRDTIGFRGHQWNASRRGR